MPAFEPKESLIGFCSAPWTDCISYADGALKACDRNVASFGNWQEKGLKNTWESEEFQEFRKAIREGRYPDQDCASCHNNGTQRTATSSLLGAYSIHYESLRNFFGFTKDQHIPELAALHPLLSLRQRNEASDRTLPVFFAHLERLRSDHTEAFESDARFRNAIIKLKVIGESLEDYLKGELRPRRVATFRQSQLQAKCTARCLMCAGKYTGEIESGPTMDSRYVSEAFAEPEDITDFWCNGSEYLFFKEWKKVALMLRHEGVRMRVSTNGILLTEPTIDFMVNNDLLGFLTMSLDAATKETMESTRIRVNYEKNMQRIRYLLKRTSEENQPFEFVAAFVMMKRNLHELPAFVRLMKNLMPEKCVPAVSVLCQPLENFNIEGYRQFVHREHHSLLGEARLREIFEATYQAEKETGITVTFYNQHLKDFMAAGMPFPRYFPRQMDVDIFVRDIKTGIPLWNETELDILALAEEAGYEPGKLRVLLAHFIQEYCAENSVISETMRAFPNFGLELQRLTPAYANSLAEKYEAEALRVEVEGQALFLPKAPPRSPEKGDFVLSAATNAKGRIIRIQSGLALLHTGHIVPANRDLYRLPACEPMEAEKIGPLLAARIYLKIHSFKNRLLGGVKSPLLWKLSVAYRWALSLLGVKVAEAKL